MTQTLSSRSAGCRMSWTVSKKKFYMSRMMIGWLWVGNMVFFVEGENEFKKKGEGKTMTTTEA